MRTLRPGVVVALLTFVSMSALAKDGLIKFGGKELKSSDLTAAEQQALFELETEHYLKVSAFADDVILERYLDARAKQAGKSREALEAQLLAAPEASDKEAQAWFDDNKGRLPPHLTFDQVKGEIKSYLRAEAVKKKKDDLVQTAKKEGAAVLLARPEAPTVTIDVRGLPTRGPASAKLKLVEFADYQCPHCKEAGEIIEKLLKKYPKELSLTFADFPINASGISRVVAHGAVCADQQGKFWEYHDRAFAEQRSLAKDSPATLAKSLGLDEAKFKACMDSDAPKQRVDASVKEGERLGIAGTPTIFLNGRRIMGHHEADLVQAIEQARKGR